MKDTSENLSAEQSLAIITGMIRQAKGNVQRNSFYFLLWGWVVAAAHIGMFVLSRLDYARPHIIWTITLPAWLVTMYTVFKRPKETVAVSHFDRVSGALWIAFGVCILTLIFFGYAINYQLTAVILLVTALPTYVSGMIIRFRPLMMGAVCFWVAGVASFVSPAEWQPLIGAAGIVCGYLVPGYMLKNQGASHV